MKRLNEILSDYRLSKHASFYSNEEKILITQINRLIDRNILSTNQIYRSLTKKIIHELIDKN